MAATTAFHRWRENAAIPVPLEQFLHPLDGGRADRVLHHAGIDFGRFGADP